MNPKQQTDVVFETRNVAVAAAKINDILPLVLASIDAVGFGSAVAAQDSIQLTYPANQLKNLVATIDSYSRGNVPSPVAYKVYDAKIVLNNVSPDWHGIVHGLGIVPADVAYQIIPVGQFGAVLVFAGPAAREATISQNIIPHIESALNCAYPKVLYSATVSLPKTAPNIVPIIDSMGLCPADMTYMAIDMNDELLIAFSGPKNRETAYQSQVLPSLRKLAGMISS